MGNDEAKKLSELEDLGAGLHTALRKCCDSTPTSIAYNLISMDAFNAVWDQYLRLIQAQETPVTVEKLKQAAKELEWGAADRNLMKLAFELFSDDDWAGFIAFVEEED